MLPPSSAPSAALATALSDTVKIEDNSLSHPSDTVTPVEEANLLGKSAPLMHRSSVLDKRKAAASQHAPQNPKRRQQAVTERPKKPAKSRTDVEHRQPPNEAMIAEHYVHPYVSAMQRLQGTIARLQRNMSVPGGDVSGADMRVLHEDFTAMMNAHPVFNPSAQHNNAFSGGPQNAPSDYYGGSHPPQHTSSLSMLGLSLTSLLSDRTAFWRATGGAQSEIFEAPQALHVHAGAARHLLPLSPSTAQQEAEESQFGGAQPYAGSHQLMTQRSSFSVPGGYGYTLPPSTRQKPEPEGARQEESRWSLDPGSNTYSFAAAAALAGRAPDSLDNHSSIELLQLLTRSVGRSQTQHIKQAPVEDIDEYVVYFLSDTFYRKELFRPAMPVTWKSLRCP
jgi:hypothetical protein